MRWIKFVWEREILYRTIQNKYLPLTLERYRRRLVIFGFKI